MAETFTTDSYVITYYADSYIDLHIETPACKEGQQMPLCKLTKRNR